VNIENGVISIGNYAFQSCDLLTSITIPGSVTTIGDAVFTNCYSLTSITFLGKVAPTSVGTDWITSTSSEIKGHASATSNFPAPGETFNGLTMGVTIPDDGNNGNGNIVPVSDDSPLFRAGILIVALLAVGILIMRWKKK
jgi:hypothetical protein